MTPTPDNTRRETIEAAMREHFETVISTMAEKPFAETGVAVNSKVFSDYAAAIDAALASAEPQAREALLAPTPSSWLAADETPPDEHPQANPAPAPAADADDTRALYRDLAIQARGDTDTPAAETEGLVERLTAELAKAHRWEKTILEYNERKAFCIRELLQEREARRLKTEALEAQLANADPAICPECRGERRVKGDLCPRCGGCAQIPRSFLRPGEVGAFEEEPVR